MKRFSSAFRRIAIALLVQLSFLTSLPLQAQQPPQLLAPTLHSIPPDSTSTPGTSFCGDGEVQFGEECDDGNQADTDACTRQCRNARCGDHFTWTGHEECDDGNPINSDGCSNSCKIPRCGDGIVQAGEECDDANKLDTDFCTMSCRAARCGDGIVQPAIGETCDVAKPLPGNTHTCGTAANGKECQLIKLPDQPGNGGNGDPNPNNPGNGNPPGFGGGGGGGSGSGGGGGLGASDIIGFAGSHDYSLNMPGGLPPISGQLDFTNVPSLSGIKVSCGKGTLHDGNGGSYNVGIALALTEDGEEGLAGTVLKEGDKKAFQYRIDGSSAETLSIKRVKVSRIKEDPKRRQIRAAELKRTKKRAKKLGRKLPLLAARARIRSPGYARTTMAAKQKVSCGSQIHVIFGYAASIEDYTKRAQIAASIGRAICDTNEVFANSDIPYQIVPVGLARIDAAIPKSGPDAVAAMADPHGNLPLNSLRFNQRADAAVLMVPPIKGSCGYAIGMGNRPGIRYLQRAHAVVGQNCMPGSVFTLAHELGHVGGADHDPENAGSERAREDAFGYVGDKIRTVMSYPPQTGVRIMAPYFSSPKHDFFDEKVGVKGAANNAAVLADTLGYVSCYGENLK